MKKRKRHSPFIDNIWGVDLADVQFKQRIRFLLCAIDISVNMHGLFL